MAMIPTVEEFLTKELSKLPTGTKGEFVRLSADADKALYDAMIEFAKLHVKAALKLASEKAKQIEDPYSYTGNTGSEYPADYIIDKDSILNAYPLKNIK